MDTFYTDNSDNVFRFGDVVRGFAYSMPILPAPLLDNKILYQIEICSSNYSVVLSPCCSIEKGILSLAPLEPILPAFFKNPWLIEDFTRLNRKMSADKAVPPHIWEGFSEDERTQRINLHGDGYAFVEYFVYNKHPVFPQYKLNIASGNNPETQYYMIDFRNIYRVKCDRIKRGSQHPVEAKVLQLSKECRDELRNKIVYYYSRTPVEDIA